MQPGRAHGSSGLGRTGGTAALAALTLALALVAGSVIEARLADELRAGGRSADAIVSEVTEDWSASGCPTCTTGVTVRFTDARGLRHRATVDYSGCDTGLAGGDVITVLYPPSRPDLAVATEGGAASSTDHAVFLGSLAVFSSLLTVVLVGLAVRSIVVRRAPRASDHTGGVTSAPVADDPRAHP